MEHNGSILKGSASAQNLKIGSRIIVNHVSIHGEVSEVSAVPQKDKTKDPEASQEEESKEPCRLTVSNYRLLFGGKGIAVSPEELIIETGQQRFKYELDLLDRMTEAEVDRQIELLRARKAKFNGNTRTSPLEASS